MSFKQKLLSLFFTIGLVTASTGTAHSASIIRDAEIENGLRIFSTPIFDAAGIGPNDVKFILIDDSQLNAFVAGGMNIFIYTGLILEAENPGELIGVIAHETGHIAGAHLIRTHEAIENASYQSLLASILGIAAAIGGGGDAASAVLLGGSAAAQQSFLSHSRTQEASADQAAVKYLSDAGYNAKGLLTFLEKLSNQEILTSTQQSEYIRTHPLSRNRISYLRENVDKTRHKQAFPPAWVERFDRIQAKLMGFIYPEQALYFPSDTVAHRYAKAIAHYRKSDLENGLKMIDALIKEEPENPYFHELRGQMLYENNRISDSIPSYAKAVSILPHSGLIRTSYAQALLAEAKTESQYKSVITNLERSLRSEPRSTLIHRLLATAYGRIGQEGNARFHLAEEATLQRNYTAAKRQIGLAEQHLNAKSPKWVRLQDLKAYIETVSARAKRSK